MIARAVFVLLEKRTDLVRARPATLTGPRVEKNVPRPANHLFLEPAPQRHAEAPLRTREHVMRHPGANDLPKQKFGRRGTAVARSRLGCGQLNDAVVENGAPRF